MSRLVGSARRASVAVLAILLGGVILVSLVVGRSGKVPSFVSFAEGRRMMLSRANRRLADHWTLDDDAFSSSKRKVPNGPDPIHNRCHFYLIYFACIACKHGLQCPLTLLCLTGFSFLSPNSV
ncbi:hypothetical protein PR202_ga28035 [Eleusine coracana subsp. coracana]|uniref:Uncharacterized protein n=1 Tax=Eleusine coracana subsp. coracana TaxID=191504 RepID=A0AAV5DHJ6_ELECO|nr:hypothetical protein PR202_ga28035 [Eleusine coracana subsp. coracana]